MRTKVIAALIALTLASSVYGQCVPTDTPAQCWQRSVAAPEAIVAAANAGVTSQVSPTASAMQDFLSMLSASLQSSSLTSNGNALTFDWNPAIGKYQPLKIEAVFNQPTLSAAATTAFGTNAAGLSTVKDSLTNTDDVTGSLTYSPATTRVGRSIEPHRAFFATLLSSAFTSSPEADDALIQALQAAGITTATFGQPINVSVTDPVKQKDLIAKLEASAKAQQQSLSSIDRLSRSFAKLLNNQPQPYISLQYHERNELVGPSETVLKATYELGFLNLNSFMKDYRAQCDPLILAQNNDPTAIQKCIGLLEAYAGNTGPDDGGGGGRIAFSLEYHDSQAVNVDLTQYSVKYDIDSGRSLVGSLTGGWIVAPRPNRKSGRIDLSVSYEDIRNAAVLTGVTPPPADVQDRLVASVTYTQKITDTISFPVSLVYANHAAYLSNVDRKLNAHFGLQYKLPTQ